MLIGRGAVDMKGAIAAFVAPPRAARPKGSLSLLITGDEEGDAVDGTAKVVHALREEGERIDHCVLGEPTSAQTLGDQIKVGRRGSLNAVIDGRTASRATWPIRPRRPIPSPLWCVCWPVCRSMCWTWAIRAFPPSNLEVTTVDVGNAATNVIPAKATARLNIRFNPAP